MEPGDDWLRYFPAGCLDERPDLHRMCAEWFAQFLRRMGEEPLHPAEPDRPLTIRLLCLPTWSRACVTRLEERSLSW